MRDFWNGATWHKLSNNIAPFIKEEFFHDRNEKVLFKTIHSFILTYTSPPTKEAVIISLDKEKSINENEYKAIVEILDTLEKEVERLRNGESDKW